MAAACSVQGSLWRARERRRRRVWPHRRASRSALSSSSSRSLHTSPTTMPPTVGIVARLSTHLSSRALACMPAHTSLLLLSPPSHAAPYPLPEAVSLTVLPAAPLTWPRLLLRCLACLVPRPGLVWVSHQVNIFTIPRVPSRAITCHQVHHDPACAGLDVPPPSRPRPQPAVRAVALHNSPRQVARPCNMVFLRWPAVRHWQWLLRCVGGRVLLGAAHAHGVLPSAHVERRCRPKLRRGRYRNHRCARGRSRRHSGSRVSRGSPVARSAAHLRGSGMSRCAVHVYQDASAQSTNRYEYDRASGLDSN